jgi:hypothetical protein
MFPPLFPEVVADHVTLQFPAKPLQALPDETEGEVVGYATDGKSVECLVVAIGGDTKRPDGRTFHITWSIDRSKGGKPFKSNQVIEQFGVTGLDPMIMIKLSPRQFRTSETK